MRLPMVEVDAGAPLTGPSGRVTLLDAFEGRTQLIAYFQMWHADHPAAEQCEGCTFFNSQVRELSYLHSRDVTYATLCQGPYEESVRYRDFMGWDVPWYSARESIDTLMAGRGPFMLACYLRQGDRVFETYWTTGRGVEAMDQTYGLLDRTAYGRQEPWEDSPARLAADQRQLHAHRRTPHRSVAPPAGRTLRRPRGCRATRLAAQPAYGLREFRSIPAAPR